MKQCPFGETNGCSATPEIPRVFSNPKVHHLLHKSPQIVLVLSHKNAVDALLNLFI
jgi:hypothetical protein